jgi:hypothetical protein
MAIQSNYPAFSSDIASGDGANGLSKREYAAIHIMAGLCAKYTMNTPKDQATLSQLSVELADTLFNELEKD